MNNITEEFREIDRPTEYLMDGLEISTRYRACVADAVYLSINIDENPIEHGTNGEDSAAVVQIPLDQINEIIEALRRAATRAAIGT